MSAESLVRRVSAKHNNNDRLKLIIYTSNWSVKAPGLLSPLPNGANCTVKGRLWRVSIKKRRCTCSSKFCRCAKRRVFARQEIVNHPQVVYLSFYDSQYRGSHSAWCLLTQFSTHSDGESIYDTVRHRTIRITQSRKRSCIAAVDDVVHQTTPGRPIANADSGSWGGAAAPPVPPSR